MNNYSYIDILISAVLILIMFGIGLSLTIKDFKYLWKHPKAVIIGILSQIIILPLLVFIILHFTTLPVMLKLGFMILAASPGGSTSGFIVFFFRGNVALSVSLTAINGLLALITVPIVVNFSLWYFLGIEKNITLPFWPTVVQIFIITIIPAICGMLFSAHYKNWTEKLQKVLKPLLLFLLALVFAIKIFAGETSGGSGITLAQFLSLLPISLLINVVVFIVGLLISLSLQLPIASSFTNAITVAMQNTTLAFLVAGTFLGQQQLLMPSLVYSMFSFWTALLFGFAVKSIFKEFRQNK